MPRTGTVKRIISLLLVITMCVAVAVTASGCGNTADNSVAQDAGKIVSETDSELTIIDQAGREVTVSKDIDSIALCYRVVIRFLLNLGQGDKITGIGKTEEFLEELQPSLKDCMDVGKGVADIEALAELGPDLFIHKSSDVETLEAVENLGIPSVGIDVETPEAMLVALDVLGKVCNARGKAEELISYYKDEITASEELAAGIGEEDRKTAIVMGTSIGKVADGTMLQGLMLEKAGAINCAAELKATELWPTAGTEQIFEWNPDFIFITGSESAVYTVNDIYKDPAWSELEAVKNEHVFLIPAACDSWEFPGVVSTLGINYMMRAMYPELLSDTELEDKVNKFYELAYGRSFSRDKLGY